jgi:hypothetical protein
MPGDLKRNLKIKDPFKVCFGEDGITGRPRELSAAVGIINVRNGRSWRERH